MTSEEHVHEQIDRMFTELEVLPESARAHLVGCASCRTHYNRVIEIDRYLNGRELAQPSPLELDRVARMILSTPPLAARLRSWILSARGALMISAVAAAVVASLIVLAPKESEFRARGTGDETRAANVRVFCVDAGKINERSPCPLSAELKLAIGNKGNYRYAFVVGLQADGEPRWYVPRPPAQQSAEAPNASEGEVPFGNAVRLSVNHQPGTLKIFALFSDQPLLMSEVEGALAGTKPDLETLPIAEKNVAQRTALLEVLPP